jgi:hypothetical protein
MTLLLLLNQAMYTVKASDTEEGKRRLQEYYSALGRFIDMFAQVETALTFTLWHYAKTPPEIAKIIFSGDRVDNSSQYIKQIAEATNATQDLRDDLTYIFDQLGIINGNRNHIVHYGAQSIAEGDGLVSNAFKAKGEPKEFPVSPTALDDMTADLRKISFHLRYRHYSGANLHIHGNQDGAEALNDVLRAPWQYKPPPQTKSRSTKGAQARTQKRDQLQPHRPSSYPP